MRESDDGAEIQRAMSSVRHEAGQEVRDIVEGARTLTDWHYYVRTYPWLCAGTAALVGFALVPWRKQIMQLNAAALRELADDKKISVNVGKQDAGTSAGVISGVVTALASMALRNTMNRVLAAASGQLQQFVHGAAAGLREENGRETYGNRAQRSGRQERP